MGNRNREVTSPAGSLGTLAPPAMPKPRLGPDTHVVKEGETIDAIARQYAQRYRAAVADPEHLTRVLAGLLVDRHADASGVIRVEAGTVLTLPAADEVGRRYGELKALGKLDRIGSTTGKRAKSKLVRAKANPTSPSLDAPTARAAVESLPALETIPLPPPKPNAADEPALVPIPLPPPKELTEMQALARLRNAGKAWPSGELRRLFDFARFHGVPFKELLSVVENAPGSKLEAAKAYAIASDAVKNGLLPAARAADYAQHFLPALRDGRLGVEALDPQEMAHSHACYLTESNVLRVAQPGLRLDAALDCAILIHEAAHVIQDDRAQAGTMLTFEKEAYTAQAEYMLRYARAVVDTPDGPQLDAVHRAEIFNALGAKLGAVEAERLSSVFAEYALANAAHGRRALNGVELDEATTDKLLNAKLEMLRKNDGRPYVPFETAYVKLLLRSKREAGASTKDGTPFTIIDARALANEMYKKDGLPRVLPKSAKPSSAPVTPRPPRLTESFFDLHGLRVRLEYGANVTANDRALVQEALARYPAAWVRAAVRRAQETGASFPTITLTDEEGFAALHDSKVDAGWFDTANGRVVINVERIRTKQTFLTRPGTGERLAADEWLQHTAVHELAHFLDAVGEPGEGVASEQGQRMTGGPFARAVRARNSSEDPADYASAYDRVMNVGLDDFGEQAHETFAEIIQVIVNEGGRARLRSQPQLRRMVDAIERYMSGGMTPELLTPGETSSV